MPARKRPARKRSPDREHTPQSTRGLSEHEQQERDEHSQLRAAVLHEIIRHEGEGELARTPWALWWSGLAAGLSIGISVLAEALIAANLPKADWTPLVDNFGYSVGFLIVILGRQQLFTESTLTAVLPVIRRKTLSWLWVMLRLWGVVLAANLAGCLIFAATLTYTGILTDPVTHAVVDIGEKMMETTPFGMVAKGIVAGWLIAALVWILPAAEGDEFLIITLITYVIALGDFTHVIAGSAEAFYLWLNGLATAGEVIFGFFLPSLAGNVIGGTALFAVLAYAQVRTEI